jgi:hypothetical protein
MCAGLVKVVVIAVVAVGVAAVSAPSAYADDGDPNPDEGSDIAIPGLVPTRQLTERSTDVPTAAPSAAVLPGIDDFRYDALVTVGTAAEACHGRLRSGALGAYQALTSRFGGTPGTLYSCRERYATHERPECNGQTASPVTSPGFWSDCWSNHAQGRAIDIMVGRAGGGYNQARGNAIVEFLLATDASGNISANARRLGVQQILWNDRCWNSDGDRSVVNVIGMRQCGIGHFDHVHIDFTIDGAEGLTSWWGHAPKQEPKINSLWYRDTQSGIWQWQTWVNLAFRGTASGSLPLGYTKMIGGDWNADGNRDEVFAWNPSTGDYQVINGTTGAQLFSGRASTAFDQFVNGDFHADGRMNDMIVLDTETGHGELWTWTGAGRVWQGWWRWRAGWDAVVALDADADGRVGETFLYNRQTGDWYAFSWDGLWAHYLQSGRYVAVWDTVVAGDFDAQGGLDDLFFRDAQTGIWVTLQGFHGYPVQTAIGSWLTIWGHFVVGDWDTDGRLDDIFVRDDNSGQWTMLSWHRFLPSTVAVGTWLPSLDTWLAGTFG